MSRLRLAPLFAIPLVALPVLQTLARPASASGGVIGVPAPPPSAAAPEVAPAAVADAPADLPVKLSIELVEADSSGAILAVSGQASDLRRCYQNALGRNAELKGEVRVAVELRFDGRFSGGVQLDDIGDWRLTSCIDDAVASWVAPPDLAGRVVVDVGFSPS